MLGYLENLRTSGRVFVFAVLVISSLLTACGGGGGDDGSGSDTPVRTTNYRVDFAPEMVIGGTAASNTITATASISSQQGDGIYAVGSVTVSGINPTSVTINAGYAGENGPVVITLNNAGGGTWNVPDTELDFDDLYRLDAAGYYISIQSPAGELRGQIVPQDWIATIIDLDADNVVPSSTSTGAAKAGLSFHPSTGTYRIRITVSGVSDVISAAVRNAIAGARGDVVINLEQSSADSNVWGSRDINNVNADDRFSLSGLNMLASGVLYFSVVSATNMNGDLRGQIVDDTIDVFDIELSTSEVVSGSPVVSDAVGVATVTWIESLSRFGVAVNTDITNALGVFVHQGAPGTDGPVLFTLTPDLLLPGNWVFAPTDLNADETTAFMNGDFYVTVQTAAYPNGELRGQLDTTVSPEATVALIGPDGGELSTPDGVTLNIPPGALAETRLISARRLTSTAALPAILADPFVPLHAAVEFGPDGLEFALPVTLTITLDKAATPGASQPVLLYDPETNGWEETEFIATVDANGETASVDLVHFSDYVITFNGKDSAGYFGKIDPFQTPEALLEDVQNRFYGLFLSGLPRPFSPGSVPIDDPNFGLDLFNCYAPRAARYTLFHNRSEMPLDEYIGDPSGATFAIQFSREFDKTIITGDINFQTVFTFDVKVFFFATSPEIEVSASPAELWGNGQSNVSVQVRCGEDGFRDQNVTLTLDNSSIGRIASSEGITNKDGIYTTTFSASADQGGRGVLTATTDWSAPLEGVPLTVNDEIGIEVFSLTGNWSGSGSETIKGCQDSAENGTFGASASFPIFQNNFGISGSAFWTSFSGTVLPQPDGTFSLSGSYTDTEDGNSIGEFNGSGNAKTGVLNLSWSGSDLDDTCVFAGSGTATRP